MKISGNAEYIAFRLTVVGHSKVTLFEILRRRWCTSVCKPGSPFWLESSEVTKDAFPYRSDETVHVLQPTFFSLGSFFDRGTYIKHWSSEDDAVSIVDEQIRAEFEHDTKNLYITFAKRDEPEGFREIRLETEFKHFENYVLVDENSSRGTIEFYFLLQVPLKVFQGEYVELHMKGMWSYFMLCWEQFLVFHFLLLDCDYIPRLLNQESG